MLSEKKKFWTKQKTIPPRPPFKLNGRSLNVNPKLKVWTPEIRLSIKTVRQKHKVWKDHGKPNDKSNIMLREKKQAKKEFRRTVRIEIAKPRNKVKENILETRIKDTNMFHKLVHKNRRHGNDMIMELEVNGKNYTENENIINGFQEHQQFCHIQPENT